MSHKKFVIAGNFQPLLFFLSNLFVQLTLTFPLSYLSYSFFKRPEQNTKITLEALLDNRSFYLLLFPSKSITWFQASHIKSKLL